MTDERNDIDIRLIDYYLNDEDGSSKGITVEKVGSRLLRTSSHHQFLISSASWGPTFQDAVITR